MTDDRSLERAARSWIETGPTEAPDRAVEAALLRIQTTPQERDLRIPRRSPTMTTPARVATAAVIGVLAVGGALFLLGRPGQTGVGGPAPSSTTLSTPTPTSRPSPTVGPTGSPTVLEATGFVVPFQITWDVPIATPQVKTDVVDIFFDRGGMNIFHVDRVGRDPCLSNDLLAQPLRTPQEFMDWLDTIPKATTGPVTAVSIDGRSALERTVSVGTLDGCIDATALHSGIVSQYGEGPGGYFMGVGEHERWIAMDANGQLVVFVVWPADDATISEAATRALATVDFSQ